MKKIIIYLLLTTATTSLFAQNKPEENKNRRKGFIGITYGPSIPVGKFSKVEEGDGAAYAGGHINLLNLGYRYTENFGAAVKWFGGANPTKLEAAYAPYEKNLEPWSYGGLLFGPMVSIPISQDIEFDFRPMIGYSGTQLPKEKSQKKATMSESAIAYSIGANMHFNIWSRIGIHTGIDFFHTNAEFDLKGSSTVSKFEQKISTITPSVGVVYRFN